MKCDVLKRILYIMTDVHGQPYYSIQAVLNTAPIHKKETHTLNSSYKFIVKGQHFDSVLGLTALRRSTTGSKTFLAE